jgi:hypothetical protein
MRLFVGLGRVNVQVGLNGSGTDGGTGQGPVLRGVCLLEITPEANVR